MAEIRKASEVDNELGFPYDSNDVCYFTVDSTGTVDWIDHTKSERREACKKLESGNVKLYAVWSGRWRSDLFEIDDINEYLKVYKS